MKAIDFLKENARGEYTVTPIRMVRAQAELPCDDYRPGDVYLKAADGPADHGCGHQHVKVRTCDRLETHGARGKHKHHGPNCFAWFHVCVEVDGFVFVNGTFTAKVFADADMPRGNEWKNPCPAVRKPKFCQHDVVDAKVLLALAALDGVECTEVLDTDTRIVVSSAQEATT